MRGVERPRPWLVSIQDSGNVCASLEYGELIADDDELATEGPEAAEKCEAMGGGVDKLVAFPMFEPDSTYAFESKRAGGMVQAES